MTWKVRRDDLEPKPIRSLRGYVIHVGMRTNIGCLWGDVIDWVRGEDGNVLGLVAQRREKDVECRDRHAWKGKCGVQ